MLRLLTVLPAVCVTAGIVVFSLMEMAGRTLWSLGSPLAGSCC